MSDIRARLEAGGCPPSHGCNASSVCLCSLVEDAADEIDRLRALLAFHHIDPDLTVCKCGMLVDPLLGHMIGDGIRREGL